MNHVTRSASRLWAVLMLVWAVAVCPAFAQTNTLIDTNAKVHVIVANSPELTGDFTVDSDGNITMLYINQVHVQGLTPAQAAAVIRGVPAADGKKATGLSQFYVNPQVIVSIVDAGGIGVDVTGLVSSPRHYVVRSNARLNDVLQQAVPALNADLTKIEVTHADTQNKEIIDYRSYLDDKKEAGNPTLQNGDVINVASHEPQPITVSVQGQVAKPGRFQVPPNTTASSALQIAGNPTASANVAGIVIKHFGAGPTDTIPFSFDKAQETPTDPTLNPVLLDGDTIVVPASAVLQTYTLVGPGVRNPAEYQLVNNQPITLAAAIGRAGGLSDRAKINEVVIIRTNPVTKVSQTIKLNATDPNVQGSYLIQAGDNVTIGQGSPPTKIDPFQIFGIAIALFGIFHH